MTRSACSNTARTTGSRLRSSASMLTYCEPWPGYRKATLRFSPEPRNTPCEVRAFQSCGSSRSSALAARSILRVRSFGFLKSMAIRSGAARSCASGASWPSMRLASASDFRRRSLVASSAPVSAPSTTAPEGGALAATPAPGPDTEPDDNSGTEMLDLRSLATWPGTYSSSTAWKLVPPKPKALTPARRTPDAGFSQSLSSVLT